MEEQPLESGQPSNRRKFFVAVLGSGAILALGSGGIVQMVRNFRVALNTKDYPYQSGFVSDSFSPDLNLMALINVDDKKDAKLYIWNYQQQRMTILPTDQGSSYQGTAWSLDSKYLLYQTQHADGNDALDLWNVQTRQRIESYTGDLYKSDSEIHWSPDSSKIALLLKDTANTFVIMRPNPLTPLFTFKVPSAIERFTWSPDSRKLAFLVGTPSSDPWSIQICDVQTRTIDAEVHFQGQNKQFPSVLSWSPAGRYIAALAHGQLQIIPVADRLGSFALDEPNQYGKIAWSPDGRYLAVGISLLNDNFLSSPGSDFAVWDVIKREKVRVFSRGPFAFSVPEALGWSKDGKQIIFIAPLYRQENWDWT